MSPSPFFSNSFSWELESIRRASGQSDSGRTIRLQSKTV
jgi:hypothetical protein